MRSPLLLLLFASIALACTPPQPWPTAYCESASNITWVIPNDVTVTDTLDIGTSQVEVHGALFVFPNATAFVTIDGKTSGQLVVLGPAVLAGTLNVTFVSRPKGELSSVLVNASRITHSFQDLAAILQYSPSECDSAEVAQATDNTAAQLTLTATIKDECVHDQHDKGAIAAASTVAGVFVALVVVFWSASVATRRN